MYVVEYGDEKKLNRVKADIIRQTQNTMRKDGHIVCHLCIRMFL